MGCCIYCGFTLVSAASNICGRCASQLIPKMEPIKIDTAQVMSRVYTLEEIQQAFDAVMPIRLNSFGHEVFEKFKAALEK